MMVPGRYEKAQQNLHPAAHQRLRFHEPIGSLQQQRQVVEACGDVGMLGAVTGLVDGQGAAHQRLRLRQAIGVLQQLRQVIEVDGDVGMLSAVTGLVDGQGAAHQRHPLYASCAGAPRPAFVGRDHHPRHEGCTATPNGFTPNQRTDDDLISQVV